jgi:hypothetical protein
MIFGCFAVARGPGICEAYAEAALPNKYARLDMDCDID